MREMAAPRLAAVAEADRMHGGDICAARPRRGSACRCAAISASGTEWPPPEPPMSTVSPSLTRRTASSAEITRTFKLLPWRERCNPMLSPSGGDEMSRTTNTTYVWNRILASDLSRVNSGY